MLTIIELHYKFWNDTIFNVHKTLNISFIANMKYKKVAPKLWRHDMMTQCQACSPYLGTAATMRVRLAICMHALMCKYPRGSKLSSSNVIRRGEVRWSHNVQFCLKSKVSLEHRGRSRSLVSARNAADDEDLQLGYVVRNVAIEFSPSRAVI